MHTTVILKSDGLRDNLRAYDAGPLDQLGIELKNMTLLFDRASARQIAVRILETARQIMRRLGDPIRLQRLTCTAGTAAASGPTALYSDLLRGLLPAKTAHEIEENGF
jgi:hypothetical protein